MAVVYRKTVSTEYLLQGVNDINGKNLDDLNELDYFYSNYEELFKTISGLARKQLDDDVARIDRELVILRNMYDERVALRAWSIDSRIEALNEQAVLADTKSERLKLRIRTFGLKLYRNTYVNRPLQEMKEEIRRKEADMNLLMTSGTAQIESQYKKLMDTYRFIHDNRSLLENARREEAIIELLSTLGNNYHIINNVNLSGNDRLPARSARTPASLCAISHIVVGPTGLYFIVMMPQGDPKSEESQRCLRHSVNISRKAREFLQANDISVYEVNPRTVLVTFSEGYSGEYLGDSVDVVSLDKLSKYLKRRNGRITNNTIDDMVQLFNR